MTRAGLSLEQELYSKLKLALAGDSQAYEAFLQQVARVLRAFLMKAMNPYTRSPEKVEDLVQDVLLAIHQKRHLYKEEMPLLPWIYAIARYRLIDSIRANKRRPEFVPWADSFEAFLLTQQNAEDQLTEDSTDALFAGLSEQQKKVLRMAKLEELPLAEIAKKLEMSLSAVKVSVHRSIHAIRENLKKDKASR